MRDRVTGLIVVAILVGAAIAGAKPKRAPSRSVVAATKWVTAMTEASATEPRSYTRRRPLEFTVQSDQEACARLTKGKAATRPEIKTLKACFVATWKYVAKEAELYVEDLRKVALDGEQRRWAKRAPKGVTWVVASRRYAGQDLTLDLALGPDGTVLAVWFTYLEHDGE